MHALLVGVTVVDGQNQGLGAEGLDHALDEQLRARVQRRERLVEQQDLGARGPQEDLPHELDLHSLPTGQTAVPVLLLAAQLLGAEAAAGRGVLLLAVEGQVLAEAQDPLLAEPHGLAGRQLHVRQLQQPRERLDEERAVEPLRDHLHVVRGQGDPGALAELRAGRQRRRLAAAAGQQREGRALARAVGPHDAELRAPRELEGDLIQDGLPVLPEHSDVFQAY
mmetsp:Transcript_67860/g.219294  ORF Transcript_67860/g.219294 Transcript_67860/m.219294 type:complete len:223 (-) Transcript_67860:991-1659(-)